MLLNRLWIGLFLIALVTALVKLIGFGDTQIFQSIVDAMFVSAKTAFEIALYLTGALCLWMGIRGQNTLERGCEEVISG